MTTLQGHGVVLTPLAETDFDELVAILDDEIWRYQPQAPGPLPRTRQEHVAWLRSWFDATQRNLAAGTDEPFAVRDDRGTLLGTSRYLAIVRAHRRVEVGGTFYAAAARGTHVNPACKRLLLAHAFETLGCLRVELKCDARNIPSRRGIAKLGAVEEGTFRQHMVLGDGVRRDTVYFSILDREWPAVRDRLDARLGA